MRLFLTFKQTFACLFLCLCLCLMKASTGHSQIVITQTQALDFGTFAFSSFNATARVTVRNNGLMATNANATMIVDGSRGEFTLTGGPPNTIYTITAPANFTLSGPGGDFNIDNIRIRPNTLRTNGAGSDNFRISARLRSLSGGTIYNNGVYNNTFDITIAF